MVFELHDFLLSRDIAKVSILGWSLRACVALDFQTGYPDMIETVYVVSLRRAFGQEEIKTQLEAMGADPVDLSECTGPQLRIFHGEKDVIAPLDKVPEPPPGVAIDVIPGTGRLPFLSSEFGRRFCVP